MALCRQLAEADMELMSLSMSFPREVTHGAVVHGLRRFDIIVVIDIDTPHIVLEVYSICIFISALDLFL